MKKRLAKPLFLNHSYNLDQLQWLQKNARLYMVGLTIITFFLVAAFWLYLNPWQPQASLSLWDNRSDQAIAEQQKPTEQEEAGYQNDVQSGTAAEEPTQDTVQQTTKDDAISQQGIIIDETEDKPKRQTIDLLALQDQLINFTVPCSGALAYNYGIGYDPVYGDYRFHDAVCYQADGAEALAVADGTVQAVDFDAPWQLTLQCGVYQLRYKGLQTCSVTEGETISAGQVIGTAGKYLIIQAAR